MNYLSIVSNQDEAVTSDGSIILCDVYIEHPRFRFTCNLCAALHYIFIRYTQDRVYTHGYRLRKSIRLFLDFVVHYEAKNPAEFHLTCVSDINIEIFRLFVLFLQKNNETYAYALTLKSALTIVPRENFKEGMPAITLPALESQRYNKTEPIDEKCSVQLETAFKIHIDKMYKKLEYRKQVDNVKPYTFPDIINEILSLFSRKNIFRYIQYRLHTVPGNEFERLRKGKIGLFMKMSNCVDDKKLVKISKCSPSNPMIRSVLKYYKEEAEPYLLSKPTDPFLSAKSCPSISDWRPDIKRVLKTLMVHGHPFNVPLKSLGILLKRCCNKDTNNVVITRKIGQILSTIC